MCLSSRPRSMPTIQRLPLVHWAGLLLLTQTTIGAAQVVTTCENAASSNVACIDRYGSVLPGAFSRGVLDQYFSTTTEDVSFDDLKNASFLVFNQDLGLELLGANPIVEQLFDIPISATDAPVYVPDTDELWIGGLQTSVTSQFVVDLSQDPPVPKETTLSPPIYAANGMRYHDGRVWVSAAGGNDTLEGGPYHPGIYSFDPATGESRVEANNYYGWYLNSANDLDIDSQGRIWFTDPLYSRNMGVNVRAPQLQASVYRYDPTTGQIQIMDDTLVFPNGIAFSPDKSVLYATDTSAGVGNIDTDIAWQDAGALVYVSTGRRTLYAFDVGSDGALTNRRPLHTAVEYVPDGIKVASNGYVLTAAGHGVDIMDANGMLLVRIQLDFIAANLEFSGANRDTLWIVGHGKVARAQINLTGPGTSSAGTTTRRHIQGHMRHALHRT
ncbi:putative SpoH [Seiridium unicorne]|uniref:SpoH n=1 Tax=Seiridium unicorne TaxID=138068 RepID=A0ABR2VBR7_9PEZI